MELDRYGPYVLAAYGITAVVLGGYLALLVSRLRGLRAGLRGRPGDGEALLGAEESRGSGD